MDKLSKEKKQQIGVVIAIGLGVVLGLYFLVIGPQGDDIADRRKKTVEKIGEVENADRLVKQSAKFQDDLDASRKKLDSIEETMASGDLYSWVINTVNKFRAAYRVDIPNFAHEERIPVGVIPDFPYEALRCNVRGTAYYHDLGKFLADFENQFPYMRVQNLELEPADAATSGDREKLAFRFDIVALLKPGVKAKK